MFQKTIDKKYTIDIIGYVMLHNHTGGKI